MPVCTVCCGTDFMCEAGFYYCSECQTQSQDIRQEVHEDDYDFDPNQQQEVIDTVEGPADITNDSSSSESTITSWEGFNISLVGLVKELMALGVDPEIKTDMLKLWALYLRRMEVAFFNQSGPALPKLGPNFNKHDAHLIYGYNSKRSKRKGEPEAMEEAKPCDSLSMVHPSSADDHLMKKRLSINQRRRAFQQDYNKRIQEMSLASQTLTDTTLEMLAVSACPDEDDGPQELQFRDDAEKLGSLTESSLKFHPGFLVRNKLICLMYLGLLRIGAKFQLSDLLRCISERHISYCNLHKFFPSEGVLRGSIAVLFGVHQPTPPYYHILYSAGRLASYIGLKACDPPSLLGLIQHYVKELNLPAQVLLLAERLLALLPPPQKFIPTANCNLPNWEGRAMAHIVIALKLLFGLDDATEHQNSRVARKINELLSSQNESLRLFVWDDWEQFCILRRTALLLLHEPSFSKSKDAFSMLQNIKPLISGWENVARSSNGASKRHTIMRDTYKSLISRLKNKDSSNLNHTNKLTFPFSLSPLSSYVEVITRAFQEGRIRTDSDDWGQVIDGLNLEMLNQKFEETTVDYLTHPNEYIEWAQQYGLPIGLRRGAAVSAIYDFKEEDQSSKPEKHMHYRVKVYVDQVNDLPSSSLPLPRLSKSAVPRNISLQVPPPINNISNSCPLPHIVDMQLHEEEKPPPEIVKTKRKGRVQRSTSLYLQIYRDRNLKKELSQREYKSHLTKEDEENMLHIPHSEYWRLKCYVKSLHADLPKQCSRMPHSFLYLLEECAMLLEMPASSLLKEVLYIEQLHRDLSEYLADKVNERSPFVELFLKRQRSTW